MIRVLLVLALGVAALHALAGHVDDEVDVPDPCRLLESIRDR